MGTTQVRDLWRHTNLGPSPGRFATVVAGHRSVLFKVIAYGPAPASPSVSYEAESAILGGSASIGQCAPCSGGEKGGNLGLGPDNTVTFNNVYVARAGNYLMRVDSMLGLARS